MFPYMGGKANHAKWISPYIPHCATYVEVFGGAMWLYWNTNKTPVQTNVYNDLNRHLVNVFACPAVDHKHFKEVLESYLFDIGSDELFTEYRDEIFTMYDDEFPIPDYPLAAKYMLCQLQTFAGGTGLSAESKIYKSPDYKHKFVTYTEKFSQPKYVKKLSQLTTENMDCLEVLNKYDQPDTFFYLDPPYKNLEHYYTEDDFGHYDHLDLLDKLRFTKAKWALSYYWFEELEAILPRDKYTWHEERTHSTNARYATAERTELLIMNYETPNLASFFGDS